MCHAELAVSLSPGLLVNECDGRAAVCCSCSIAFANTTVHVPPHCYILSLTCVAPTTTTCASLGTLRSAGACEKHLGCAQAYPWLYDDPRRVGGCAVPQRACAPICCILPCVPQQRCTATVECFVCSCVAQSQYVTAQQRPCSKGHPAASGVAAHMTSLVQAGTQHAAAGSSAGSTHIRLNAVQKAGTCVQVWWPWGAAQ